MINNVLKLVGVENGKKSSASSSSAPSSVPPSPNDNNNVVYASFNDAYRTSSSYSSNVAASASASPGENLASTIGGFLNNFQETFQLDGKAAMVAGALDSTGAIGVMKQKSWNASSANFSSGVVGGRYKNSGGRGYYNDPANCGRRETPLGSGGVVSQRGQKGPKKSGKSSHRSMNVIVNNSSLDTNGMYQGRKMVSNIDHLYHVVDDRQAYENYDTLMEVTSAASAQAVERMLDYSSDSSHGRNIRRGESRRRGSRDSSQEQRQNWARMKEEELVDRMLSQFPEFGTNRPTPFTVMDEDDDDDNGNPPGDCNSIHPHLRRGDGVNKNNVTMIGAKSAIGTAARRGTLAVAPEEQSVMLASNNNNPYSPARFFPDDASDLIGRFFLGMGGAHNLNAGGATGATGATAANDRAGSATGTSVGFGDADFKRTASFESAGSMSTLAASAGGGAVGRKGGNAVGSGDSQQQRGDHPHDATAHISAAADFGKDDSLVLWDQDEIDLWTGGANMRTRYSCGSSLGSTQMAKLVPCVATTASSRSAHQKEERQNGEANTVWGPPVVEDSWHRRRRRHHERHKKCQEWDSLRLNYLAAGTVANDNGLIALKTDHLTTCGIHREEGGVRALSYSHSQQSLLRSLQPDCGVEPLSHLQPLTKDGVALTDDRRQHKGAGGAGGGGGAVIVDDGRQHWMPDNLCKHCYSCEAPFTLLRRKHHCRVCGMIFCSACSAYFVQISSQSDVDSGDKLIGNKNKQGGAYNGTMRTCKMCYDHLSERGLGVIMRDSGVGGNIVMSEGPNGLPSLDSRGGLQLQHSKKQSTSSISLDKMSMEAANGVMESAVAGVTGAGSPILRKGNSSILLPTTEDGGANNATMASSSSVVAITGEQFAGLQGTGDFSALSMMKRRLDEEGRKREERERLEAEKVTTAVAAAKADEETAALAIAKGGMMGGRLKARLGSSVRGLKWKSALLEAKDAEEEEETISAVLDAVEVSVGGGGDAAVAGEEVSAATGSFSSAPLLESNSVIGEALAFGPTGQSNDAKVSAKIHLGMVAADYLEKLGKELLHTDAPLLLEEIKEAASGSSYPMMIEAKLTDLWVDTLMMLATRCCTTVEPNVKGGDLLDIRPYCKVKVIPGGSVEDSAYMSGVVFHKNVSHKKMACIILNAKIMMLSGGIEYTRTENRIASLDTLLEQEERYMEILVTKIFKLKPDVLIVGKSVCRKAQELLLRADIVLVQYVKSTLMTRIARQTGATVLSSIDHVINSSILGFCRRFRLVSFRDNDVWIDGDGATSGKAISSNQKSVPVMLSQNIPNHERQAALAARKLGESVLDGMEAVTLGLAKRGVVKTYVMIEGCPKELGCTVVLRGASRPALKMVKRVLRFLINCSYNMKLETSYILERCCRLPPSYAIPKTPCCSSSLCVDFGQPPNNRKARPWNGSKNDGQMSRSLSGRITPLDHQAILITSVWMTDKTQCCPAEVKGICYYSMQDVSLGQFLRDSCFNLSLKCQNPSCKKSVIDHSLSFIHNDGLINISVERMDNPIPMSSLQKQQKNLDSSVSSKQETPPDYEPIATWTFCTKCNQVVTPLTFLSKQTWQWSFGKFLEVYFYNRDAIINAPGHCCSCRMQTNSQLFFGCGSLAARFTYEKISPYSVFCRRHLPFDEAFHRMHALQDLENISVASSSLFARYNKQIEAISAETRELFGSAMNKPEHLQAVLSELNLVSAEVGNASKVLQEKISSVASKYSKVDLGKRAEVRSEYNEALFNFPWYSRRYLFMLATAWNERLSAAGQALSAMKKIQHAGGSGRGDSAVVPTIVGDASTEDVIEGMKRIRMLQETYLRNYNVAKMTMPRSHKGEGGLFEGNILPDGRVLTLEQEAEIDDEEFYSDPDNDIDFEDNIDADVLASRNRVYSPQASSSSKRSSRQHPKKNLGRKRASDLVAEELAMINDQSPSSLGFGNNYDSSIQLESQGKSKAVTAGGAVKSALNRFFNRGGNKEDPYVVDLGFFGEGRPRLQPSGNGGLVIPVFDDQPSTIIAHSLASSDYDVQFKQFLTATSHPESRSEPSRRDIERRMLGRNKSHIKHTFRDFDEKGQQLCKFVCTTFWSVQFSAVRQAFMNPLISSKEPSSGDTVYGSAKTSGTMRFEIEKSYIRSLAQSFAWAASGGKSGAAFSRTTDDRFVIKCISRTELQMFLDCAPAYFEYLSKAFFHGLPTVLCKIVGVYQIGYHNRVTGRRTMEQVAVMQNIFYGRKISKIFDLKGSLRGRFTRQGNAEKEKKSGKKPKRYRRSKSDATSESDSFSSCDEEDDDTSSTLSGGAEKDEKVSNSAEKGEKVHKSESIPTLLDGDFLEFTSGRPLPLTDRAKAVFHMSILNDTLFLSIINVLDYSILVGIDEEEMELVVGIIDFMRQYDILKQMERVGKSLPMVVGSEAPTIIQPPLYKARFTSAMERYFMTVPSKWTTI